MRVRMPAARTAVVAKTVRFRGFRLRSFIALSRLTSISCISIVFIWSEMLRVVLAIVSISTNQAVYDLWNFSDTIGRCNVSPLV